MASAEQQLTAFFRQLTAEDQLTLLRFAEFLAGRSSPGVVAVSREPVVVPEPEVIERPAGESVVAALKRLSKTYPMLDKTEMLSATSDLVAANIMQGTDAVEVVDQLEDIFRGLYEKLKSGGHE
ncbi:MAG: Crp/Fnr family transcriptional regulator [Gammaproteobacteria bacterium]|nr:Crp/Fnr family transcriptional regulator [Gammaproteobacteria bacterium]